MNHTFRAELWEDDEWVLCVDGAPTGQSNPRWRVELIAEYLRENLDMLLSMIEDPSPSFYLMNTENGSYVATNGLTINLLPWSPDKITWPYWFLRQNYQELRKQLLRESANAG